MGMAASQARFLNLTARKSNTEYQGQQVNQSRTVLANESANIVAQMAALTVPTPPIELDYSKMAYAYTDDNGNSIMITDFKKTPDAPSDDMYDLSITKRQHNGLGIYQDVDYSLSGKLSMNPSGRITSITLTEENVKNTDFAAGTYNLGITRARDDAGYESAWNQYLYDKDVYERKVQELNAKTSQIQAEDKTLELQLKQLDTEQEALTQEMEAVKAVIQKNVEKTFNTFA